MPCPPTKMTTINIQHHVLPQGRNQHINDINGIKKKQ
jgi:hypothetical protein